MSSSITRSLTIVLSVVLAVAAPVEAHHGGEFLLLEDYQLPEVWRGHLATGVDWEKYGSLNTFATESMVFLSIAPQVALSVGTGFNDEESSWRYAAVTPRIHLQLTPPEWEFPLRIGVSLGYQFVDGAAGYGTKRVRVVSYETQDCGCSGKKSTTTTVTSSGGSSGVITPPCDPLVDVDCPGPAPAPKHAGHPGGTTSSTIVTSSSSGASGNGKSKTVRKVTYVNVPEAPGAGPTGIHNHDDNLWTGRVVAELDLGATKVIFNLLGIAPEGRGPSWGYAAGVRHQLSHSFGMGVESIGDFDKEGLHELVLGCYFSPTHEFSLKVGAGIGLTNASPDFSLRTGFLWRF